MPSVPPTKFPLGDPLSRRTATYVHKRSKPRGAVLPVLIVRVIIC